MNISQGGIRGRLRPSNLNNEFINVGQDCHSSLTMASGTTVHKDF